MVEPKVSVPFSVAVSLKLLSVVTCSMKLTVNDTVAALDQIVPNVGVPLILNESRDSMVKLSLPVVLVVGV